MSYAVLRMQKIKNLGGLGKHIDRSSQGHDFIPENADNARVENNIHWDKDGNSYSQKEWNNYTLNNSLTRRINNEIKERYILDKKIRKDAVKAVEYIMSSDNLKMKELFNNNELYTSWIKDNKMFLEQIYGKENIVSMHLHMDEQTPHLHAIVIPITEDGRLSCKSFINGRKDLINQQTNYAKIMQRYGMQRGELGSASKHQRPNTNLNYNKDYDRSY